MVRNISIRVEHEVDGVQYTDTVHLSCRRLPDHETQTPYLLKPRHGEAVPSGLFVSYVIPEDVLAGSVKLRILPRGSAKYETDDRGIREIAFRAGSWPEESGKKHTVKMCPKLTQCLSTEMGQIVASIDPEVDLKEFTLYDIILQYSDRWDNPHGHRRVNHLMVVRDWTDDLAVLRTLYDSLHGDQWTIGWNLDRDDDFCSGRWYGVRCNELNHIVELNLCSNNLRGTLPAAIGKLSTLKHLDLSANYITGGIPTTIQLLLVIESISLAANSLFGPLPIGLENMMDLHTLNLAGNMLSGTFPEGLLVAAKSANLKNLWLNSNRFRGFIPDQLADVKGMDTLFLADNDWWCPLHDVPTDYKHWARHTDYTSIQKCFAPPNEFRKDRHDLVPPQDLLLNDLERERELRNGHTP